MHLAATASEMAIPLLLCSQSEWTIVINWRPHKATQTVFMLKCHVLSNSTPHWNARPNKYNLAILHITFDRLITWFLPDDLKFVQYPQFMCSWVHGQPCPYGRFVLEIQWISWALLWCLTISYSGVYWTAVKNTNFSKFWWLAPKLSF